MTTYRCWIVGENRKNAYIVQANNSKEMEIKLRERLGIPKTKPICVRWKYK